MLLISYIYKIGNQEVFVQKAIIVNKVTEGVFIIH